MVRSLYSVKAEFFCNDARKRYKTILVVEEGGRTHRIPFWPDFIEDLNQQILRIEGEGYRPLTQAEDEKEKLEKSR